MQPAFTSCFQQCIQQQAAYALPAIHGIHIQRHRTGKSETRSAPDAARAKPSQPPIRPVLQLRLGNCAVDNNQTTPRAGARYWGILVGRRGFFHRRVIDHQNRRHILAAGGSNGHRLAHGLNQPQGTVADESFGDLTVDLIRVCSPPLR